MYEIYVYNIGIDIRFKFQSRWSSILKRSIELRGAAVSL